MYVDRYFADPRFDEVRRRRPRHSKLHASTKFARASSAWTVTAGAPSGHSSASSLKGGTPSPAVVVTYRDRPEYRPLQEDLCANFPISSKPGDLSFFKLFATDEMWSEAGEREAFLWFVEPD
jgi:hypothetical protein